MTGSLYSDSFVFIAYMKLLWPSVAAAQIWNSLLEHIVSSPTLQSFGRHKNVFYYNNLPIALSGPCSGFVYLGHVKKHPLIDLLTV